MNATSPNKLKRETAFLCPAEFRNDLPLVPSDWKFLHRPNLCESISDYHHVSLIGEARDAVLPADLGLTVDPLLSSSYREKQFRPPLEHVDNKLLEEEKDREMVADNHKIRNKRPYMSKALWLMNTQYISSMPLPEHLGRSEKDWAKHKQIRDQDAAPNDSHIQQIKSIDRSFTAVKHRLSKDSSQDVFPIMELPVLPDFAHSSSSFVHFIYDEDPSDDARPENGSCLTRMHTALENSFVKPYSVNCLRGDTGAEKLVALMLPSLSNHDVRVQGRVESRRLSPLPVAPRRARGAHGAAASREEDNGRGDHGRRGRDRRAAFRGEHRVHHGERGRRADGCAKGDMRRLRVHPPGALPRREARRGEAADALARRPTRRALSLSLSLYIPATQCATSPYPISCRTRADRSNQIAPFASDANDSTASAPRVSTSPSPRRS